MMRYNLDYIIRECSKLKGMIKKVTTSDGIKFKLKYDEIVIRNNNPIKIEFRFKDRVVAELRMEYSSLSYGENLYIKDLEGLLKAEAK